MAKSLRDEVAELRDANQGSWLGEHLRQILARHPPADGVVVPRELLANLRMIAQGAHADYVVGPFVNDKTVRWYADKITQADAILAQRAGG